MPSVRCRSFSLGLLTIIVPFNLLLNHCLADESRLRLIRASLTAHVEQVKSLSGRFMLENTNLHDHATEANQIHFLDTTYQIRFDSDFVSNRVGYEEQKSFRIAPLGEEPIVVKKRKCYDGKVNYTLLNTVEAGPFIEQGAPPNSPHKLKLQAENQMFARELPIDWIGLRFTLTGWQNLTWPKIFASSSFSVEHVGLESVEGHQCDHVQIRRGDDVLHMWGDPARDFLPRRLTIGRVTDEEGRETILVEYLTEEFVSVADSSGHKSWMPKEGWTQNVTGMRHRLSAQDYTLNPKFHRGQFQILPTDLPDGVRVESVKGKRSYTGNRKDLWEARDEQVTRQDEMQLRVIESNSRSSASQGSPIEVEPPRRGRYWPWLLGAFSIALIAMGFRFKRTR